MSIHYPPSSLPFRRLLTTIYVHFLTFHLCAAQSYYVLFSFSGDYLQIISANFCQILTPYQNFQRLKIQMKELSLGEYSHPFHITRLFLSPPLCSLYWYVSMTFQNMVLKSVMIHVLTDFFAKKKPERTSSFTLTPITLANI